MRLWLIVPVLAIVACQCAGGGNEAAAVPVDAGGGVVGMKTVKEQRSGEWTPDLSDSERRTLFEIAGDSLKWALDGGRGRFSFEKYSLTDRLKEKAAVFVTFLNRGRLRGCIGILEAQEPLYLAVHEYAVHASRDSRFVMEPITIGELPGISIHVSILSAMRDIPSPSEFKIGEHGIVLSKGMRRAVYLPEVAVEQGWTREETLSSLCHKAGLPGDAWKEGASFKVFSSVVLSVD
jgi:MEMO1 family protein